MGGQLKSLGLPSRPPPALHHGGLFYCPHPPSTTGIFSSTERKNARDLLDRGRRGSSVNDLRVWPQLRRLTRERQQQYGAGPTGNWIALKLPGSLPCHPPINRWWQMQRQCIIPHVACSNAHASSSGLSSSDFRQQKSSASRRHTRCSE
jgi:hypothetical protein